MCTLVQIDPIGGPPSLPQCAVLVRHTNLPTIEIFRTRLELLGFPEGEELTLQNFLNFIECKASEHKTPIGSYCHVARELVLEAVRGVRQGGFGISAAIIDDKHEILAISSNQQIQQKNTGLHAEMSVLDIFESQHKDRLKISKETLTGGRSPYPPGLKLVSSTEPCPMCLTRCLQTGIKVGFLAYGGSDGMTRKTDELPVYWRERAELSPPSQFKSNSEFSIMSHLLFYSFLLIDNSK